MHFLKIIQLLSIYIAFHFPHANAFQPKKHGIMFDNFIFIHEFCDDENFNKEISQSSSPKLIIRCFKDGQIIKALGFGIQQIALPKFGSHRYTHVFYKVISDEFLNFWKELYGGLSIGQSKLNYFQFAEESNTKYLYYDAKTYKEDYWRSQWNQDQFVIKDNAEAILKNLQENYNQLPTNLQKIYYLPPVIQNFDVLFYTAMSGWGQNSCIFYNIHYKIFELTKSFNAADMLFCDVFRFYNLTFMTHYNFNEFRWIRAFLLRDDFASESPPDANAVFYESPGVTFVLLKERPILADNILRPFTTELWIAIALFCTFVYVFSKIFSKKFLDLIFAHFRKSTVSTFATIRILLAKNDETLESQSSLSIRIWIFCTHIYRIVLTSGYGGMILVGIMNPSYPWTPNTFKELNQTSNFVGAIPFNSAVTKHLLTNRTNTLGGISTWLHRYTENGKWANGAEREPNYYFKLDEQDEVNRYAVFMYDDKKFNYVYGRSHLYETRSQFVLRMETNKDSVLHEMRYMSVAPGATKLHFLINAIRRCFETGSFIRWKYLENNYYKYVAPRIVQKFGVHEDLKIRALNTMDVLTTLYCWSGGLIFSAIVLCIELKTRWLDILHGITSHIFSGISWVLLMVIKFLLASSYMLQRLRSWLISLSAF